jgi:hypothetical protein
VQKKNLKGLEWPAQSEMGQFLRIMMVSIISLINLVYDALYEAAQTQVIEPEIAVFKA